ncbi:MAG: RHS repeat-associated core domain-containing protein [Kiritimatiellae bacterium]|nr:RHS repeat-associated core domain-containing protein [Kiritimatiellia bacterium]
MKRVLMVREFHKVFLPFWFCCCSATVIAAWTEEIRKSEYTSTGLREDYVMTASSDNGMVTNSISRHDFLGRKILEWTPHGTTTNVYDGATSRIVTSTFTDGTIYKTTTYLYNDWGEGVGTVVDGVTNRTDVGYEQISNEWWRVTTTSVIGSNTNSVSAFKQQLTGLGNGLRGRTIRIGTDGVTTTSVRIYDDATNIETETERHSTGEWAITRRMYGLVLDVQTAEGTTANCYDAFGRVAAVISIHPNGTTNFVSRTTYTAAGDVASVDVYTNGVLSVRETYDYNALGQCVAVTNAAGHSTRRTYDPFGNVLSEDGATSPVRYAYDTSGRRTAMWTTRDGHTWDETHWTYDPQTGFCTSKVYADGSSVGYEHASDGLLTHTTFPSGMWRENLYGQDRQLCGVRYSSSGMDYDLSIDSLGMATNIVDAAGNTWCYCYGQNSTLTNESWQSNGHIGNISHGFDEYSRPCGMSLRMDGLGKMQLAFRYDADNQLERLTITNEVGRGLSVTYTNDVGYACGYQIEMPSGDLLKRTLQRDQQSMQLVKKIDTTFNGVSLDSRTYSYDALGQPVARDADLFSYNSKGEITNATIGAHAIAHAYDLAGNHLEHTMDASTNRYTHNSLNQTLSGMGNGNANFTYTLDGELASDGKWNHAYDVESRLVSSMTAELTNGAIRVCNEYDYRHRRISKTVEQYVDWAWMTKERHAFAYDGWNLIHETVTTIIGVETNITEIQYFWGLDLSGSLGGAGGVGGLLAVESGGFYYFPISDNNGNIAKYVNESGQTVAQCEYDDYGRILSRTGTLAGLFAFWASTKYFDKETGLYYYGYRFYSPDLRCWLTRDPLGEEGGLNLYEFVQNNPMTMFDPLGQAAFMVLVGDRKDFGKHEQIVAWGMQKIDTALAYLDKMSESTYECLRKAGKVTFDGKRFNGTLSEYKKKIRREKQTVIRVTAAYDETVKAVSSLSKKATEPYDWFGVGMHSRLSLGNKPPVLVGFSDKELVQKKALSSIRKKVDRKCPNVLIASCYQTWHGKTLKGSERNKFREFLDPVWPNYTFTVSGPQAQLKFTPFKLVRRIGKK